MKLAVCTASPVAALGLAGGVDMEWGVAGGAGAPKRAGQCILQQAVQTPGWAHLLLTLLAALLVWRTRLHVLFLIAAGAVIGALELL